MPAPVRSARSARSPEEFAGVPLALAVSPRGVLHLDPSPSDAHRVPAPVAARVAKAFAASPPQGLIHLGTVELGAELDPSLAFGRELAKLFFTRLASVPELEAERARLNVADVAPPAEELAALAASAPPMSGAEYLSPEVLAAVCRPSR